MGRDYYVIKGKFTWRQITRILNKKFTDEYRKTLKEDTIAPCGLKKEIVTYRIYTKRDPVEGSSSAHICLHSDGICFSGSLNIDQDWKLARELSEEIKKNIKE